MTQPRIQNNSLCIADRYNESSLLLKHVTVLISQHFEYPYAYVEAIAKFTVNVQPLGVRSKRQE
jgi:hypothetical protein